MRQRFASAFVKTANAAGVSEADLVAGLRLAVAGLLITEPTH